MYFQVF